MQSKVLRELAKLNGLNAETSTQLNEQLNIYQSLARRRNELLHNPIGRSVENEVYIMLRAQATEGIPYQTKPISPSEIDELADSIRGLDRALLTL